MRPIQIDENELIDLYVNQKLTIRKCSIKLGINYSSLYRRLKKLEIEIRPPTRRLIEDIPDDRIIDLYWNQKLSISETAQKLNRSETFVKNRLNKSERGTRTVREGARLWRKSDEITNEQLIYLHDILEWSCRKISLHFDKSEEFVRQRFMVIGKSRNETTGCHNGSWKGGITDIRNAVRSCAASIQWRNDAFSRQQYKSEISGQQVRNLNCHHIYPFHIILQSSLTKNIPLSDEYHDLAIIHDQRFYDDNNSLVVSKEEHDKIEAGKFDQAHPWWKIWQAYPDFAIKRSKLNDNDFQLFNDEGQIESIDYTIQVSNISEIRSIIRYEHYLGTVPGSKLILVAKKDGIIIGIATFGMGANKYMATDTWELTRLCVPFYVMRPFACDFLYQCCDHIRKNYPKITKLISFADSSVGHNGGIYRMAGWQKAGKTQSSYAYFDPSTFQLKHKASCRRIKNIDKTERELAQERGWIRIPLGHKYRYTLSL